MEKTKAFAYLRVSGKGQVDGDGFTRQRKAITEYAAAHGLRIVKTFKEEGISGTVENLNRPAWCELMAALLGNGTKTIIVERLDRLARDLMVQETAIADLHKHGFSLISTAEPDLMAHDPTRILMRQMMGAVAQYEKTQLVIKLRVARDRMRTRSGRCEGAKPYGTRPGEDKILARMKTLRSEGLGFDRIAARLNSEHKPTRSGKPWHGFTVNGILGRNPVNTVEADVVQALVGFGATRKDAEAAVARVRRDGDTFDSLFRRASVAR